eukprot:scaffold8501_cov129-Isochrysis_galbana.AAC.1
MEVIVKKALPLDLVDDPSFRKAVEMTAKSGGKNMIVGGKLQLPHRTHMTTTVLPAVDDELTVEINAKVQGLAEQTGVTIISDGWTNVSKQPIINALVSLPLGSYFLTARDTTGHTKDAEYIAEFMIEQIQAFGKEKVVAVCMDGACTASFPLISTKLPHIFTFICPTHSLDNFMKNICSAQAEVTVKGIKDRVFKWGEPIFAQVSYFEGEGGSITPPARTAPSLSCRGMRRQPHIPACPSPAPPLTIPPPTTTTTR